MTETVTIPKEEYDRMLAALEDAEDNAAVSAHMQRPEEGMPLDMVKRLMAGESPVAIHREWRGLSQTELARLSHVNRVQIADIEAGRSVGSVVTLKKLASALDAPLDELAQNV